MWAGDKIEPLSFPKGERGGPPQPIVQRRSSAFDPLISKQNSPTGQPVVPQSQRRSIDLSKPSGQPNWLQQSGNGQPSWAQHSGHVSPNSNSWSFYTIGSSRNKRKLPSGKETVSEFSCRHRPPGYYADINLGCEVSANINKNVWMSLDLWPQNNPCSPATMWGLSMVNSSQLQVAKLAQICPAAPNGTQQRTAGQNLGR